MTLKFYRRWENRDCDGFMRGMDKNTTEASPKELGALISELRSGYQSTEAEECQDEQGRPYNCVTFFTDTEEGYRRMEIIYWKA